MTLVAGVALEQSGDTLATHFGVNGVIFGATILATASALPEISSGIAAVRLGDNALAMGDIFGGNAFQVCLFLLADLIAGKPVLPSAGDLNAWLAALGIALTAVYGFGVIIRPIRCHARLGPDSLLALQSSSAWASPASSSSRTEPAAARLWTKRHTRVDTRCHAHVTAAAAGRGGTAVGSEQGKAQSRHGFVRSL